MSDLVGNPEDRFSRVAAHVRGDFESVFSKSLILFCCPSKNGININNLLSINL